MRPRALVERPPFELRCDQVPDYPDSSRWPDLLRWCLAVMDGDDPDLASTSAFLTRALICGLTVSEAGKADRIVGRIFRLWLCFELSCQRGDPAREGAELAAAEIESIKARLGGSLQ